MKHLKRTSNIPALAQFDFCSPNAPFIIRSKPWLCFLSQLSMRTDLSDL
jgi:hypothetical protein